MSLSGAFFIVAGTLVLLALAILKKLVVDEVSGWLVPLNERLIRIAASRLPNHSQRYEEEWLAELAAFEQRQLSALRFAVGILRGARALGSALEESAIGTAASPGSEIVAAAKRAVDPEHAASVIRRILENSHSSGWTWADLLAELRAGIPQASLDDDIRQLEEDFADHLATMNQCEPYEQWLAEREDDLRQNHQLADPAPSDLCEAQQRPRPGLSGPSWWRRQ